MTSKAGTIARALLAPITSRVTPAQMARGLVLGVFLGVLPKDNLLAIGVLVSILFWPNHLGMAAFGCALGWLLGPFLDPVSSPVGELLLAHSQLQPFWIRVFQIPMVPWLGIQNTVVLGTSLLAVAGGPPIYFLNKMILSALYRIAQQHEFDRLILDARRYQKTISARKRLMVTPVPSEALALIDRERLHTDHLHQPIPEPHSDSWGSFPSGATETSSSESPSKIFEGLFGDSSQVVRLDDPQSIGPDNLSQRESPSRLESSLASVGPNPSSLKRSMHEGEAAFTHRSFSGIRLDPPETDSSRESADRSSTEPAASEEPKSSTLKNTAKKTSDPSIDELATLVGVGDIVRETLIEVVRFRPEANDRDTEGLRLKYPSLDLKSTRTPILEKLSVQDAFSWVDPTPSQVFIDSDGATTISPMTSNATPLHGSPSNMSNPSSDAAVGSVTKIPKPAMNHSPEPAEESLRYLLWHLNSLNREQRS